MVSEDSFSDGLAPRRKHYDRRTQEGKLLSSWKPQNRIGKLSREAGTRDQIKYRKSYVHATPRNVFY